MKIIKKHIMALILIFIMPLLVNISLCYMFKDHQILEIPTAVYLGDDSQFARTIVNYFDESDKFDINYYVQDPYEIEELIKTDKVKMGILIPKDFYKDLKNLKSPTILTVYDGTQLASTSFGKIQAGETLLTLKTGALIKLVQAKLNLPYEQSKKLILSIGTQSRILFNPTRNYLNFLMPGFMAAMVQVGLIIATAASGNWDKIKSYNQELLSKIGTYSIAGFVSMMINILIQVKIFDIAFRGNLGELILLTMIFSICVSSIGIFISIIVKDKIMASQLAAMLFLPNTIMAGYTWPLIGMPSGYRFIGKFIPLYHYADPLRDMMIKGYYTGLNSSMVYLSKISLFFIAFALIILYLKYSKQNNSKFEKEGNLIEIHQ